MPPLSLSSILLHDLELAKVFQKENAWHHQPIAEGPLPQKYQPIHYLLLLHLSVIFEAFFFFFFFVCLIPLVVGKTSGCSKLLYSTQKRLRVIFLLYKSEHIILLLKYFNASPFLSR